MILDKPSNARGAKIHSYPLQSSVGILVGENLTESCVEVVLWRGEFGPSHVWDLDCGFDATFPFVSHQDGKFVSNKLSQTWHVVVIGSSEDVDVKQEILARGGFIWFRLDRLIVRMSVDVTQQNVNDLDLIVVFEINNASV